ncbi:hypothetical protein P1P68_12680 [Streptomyces scabiei]|uniref:hypothetical protein n=1 Tax=Streptomyces scabiei TaxID=1930 RepID=UPI00298FD288|nr:hypothetical protein [Streptomyces scabiei]MDW8805614.1 hypothetical protein [Streptomyces scabiei]
MDPLQREDILDDGALRIASAIREAQLLRGTEEFWAAVWEVERIRIEVELATGERLIEPAPPHLVDVALESAGRVTAAQLQAQLEGTS